MHIHGNNNNSLIENLNFPEVPEITFINKKHCNNLAYSKKFPVVNLDSHNNPKFNGAWNVYPFFDSGVIAINDIDSGLFLVKESE